MQAAFSGANKFNQALHSWDTSKVLDMQAVFEEASMFNQALQSWDTATASAFDVSHSTVV